MVNYLNSVRGAEAYNAIPAGPTASRPQSASSTVQGNLPAFGQGSALTNSFLAAQSMREARPQPIGTPAETRNINAAAQARENLSRLLGSVTSVNNTVTQPSTEAMMSLIAPRPFDPVAAISQAQNIRDDMRRQRREEAAVRLQNSVVQNPLRQGQVFPDGNRAPWQDNIPRVAVPWLRPPQPGDLAEPAEEDTPVIYDGDGRECSICTLRFEAGERVARLTCRHMFHSGCWERYQISTANRGLVCPNCRGAGHLTAVWDYIAPDEPAEEDVSPQGTTHSYPAFGVHADGRQLKRDNETPSDTFEYLPER